MSRSLQIQKYFVILVLVIHGIWIANHLRWVAYHRIDPWKLGGYGMYTVPSQLIGLNVIDLSAPGTPVRLDSSNYAATGFLDSVLRNNPGRVFRCAHIRPADLEVFFKENPQLHGVNLAIIFTEVVFIRNPVSMDRAEQGRVQVEWVTPTIFVYGSQFCGSVETGEASLP